MGDDEFRCWRRHTECACYLSDQVDWVAAAGDSAPHLPEHFAALLFLASVGVVTALLLLGAVFGGVAGGVVFGGLLDLNLIDGDALGFEGGLELAEAVAEQARGVVVTRL